MIKEDLIVLMLEDNSLDAELNQEQLLLLEEYNCKIKVIQDREEYIKEITSCPPPDLILCDYNLPQYNGMEALKDLNSLKLMIPFIFVTGTMQEEVAVDAIKAGAWDYVVKDRLFRLPLAVQGVLKLKKENDLFIEAEKTSQRLLKAIEKTSTQVVVLDRKLNIEYVNKNFTNITGYAYSELIGKYFLSIFPSEDSRAKERYLEILRGEKLFKGEEYVQKKIGTRYWEHISITPIHNDKNEIHNYIIIKDDITQLKNTEQQLMQSVEKYQSLNEELNESIRQKEEINRELETAKKKAEESDSLKTAFLANLSHEIRTPMNGILGFAELIKSENLAPEMLHSYIDIIEHSGQRMLDIISDLVDISKIESDQVEIKPENTNLNELVEKIFNFFKPQAQSKEIQLSYSVGLPVNESHVLVDSVKLQQILTNLLNNALKFTETGEIKFSCDLSGEKLVFRVKDTGVGIPPNMEEIIFERFRQVENAYYEGVEGSGLGLSISKAFIEHLGGEIWVESEYGNGSEFIFTIPYNPIEGVHEKHIPSENITDSKGITVLVAEDEHVNYLYLEKILLKKKYSVLHAGNGRKAVECFEEHPEIKVILMDIKMPVMNGIDAIIEIRKKNSHVPIIVQTAYTSENEKQEALDAGCNEFITKPINKDDLLMKLECVLSTV